MNNTDLTNVYPLSIRTTKYRKDHIIFFIEKYKNKNQLRAVGIRKDKYEAGASLTTLGMGIKSIIFYDKSARLEFNDDGRFQKW